MQDIYIKAIAEKASCRSWQVENCIQLFEEGSTIPFISRYRKERTGGLLRYVTGPRPMLNSTSASS